MLVLAKDEAIHLRRMVESFDGCQCRFLVVDSGSTDGTQELARELGARVVVRAFKNYADQFNWALGNLRIDTPWTMRMDADEYLLPGLADELGRRLPSAGADVGGWMVRRRVVFWGRWIRHGGYYPTWLLRVWRTGCGRVENRFMDEHVSVSGGRICELRNDIADENLKGLGFWTDKHNRYADREVLDLLASATVESAAGQVGQAGRKRWLKTAIYARAPLFWRALMYWGYRYFLRLGFLDGRPGLVFHFLQAFWYRFLVDAKLYERSRRRSAPALSEADGPAGGRDAA